MKKLDLGRSLQGRPLEAISFGSAKDTILFLSGVHGDELEGVWLMDAFTDLLSKSSLPILKSLSVTVWPRVNPDGVALNQRVNANGVDLNRNLPTKDWTPEIKNPRYPPGQSALSELENQALVKLIKILNPLAVLSAHSFSKYQINANGPSVEWANELALVCGYEVTQDIGYPTPGSLGTYAGTELQIPTITLEIERGLSQVKVLEMHLPVLFKSIEYWNKKVVKS